MGQTIPPVIIFPRVKFRHHMINETPTGTLGLAAPSGWMNTSLFSETIDHFVKYIKYTQKNPAILIMDNHSGAYRNFSRVMKLNQIRHSYHYNIQLNNMYEYIYV